MCVIVMKPRNIEMPSVKTLKNCFTSNSDGAGVSIAIGDKVVTHKGFMTWDSFNDYIDKISKTYNTKKYAIMFHFRIRSVGKVQPEQCHPYPVKSDMKDSDVKDLTFESKVVLSHNGTMPIQARGGFSDTQVFMLDYIPHIARMAKDIFHQDALALIENITKGKLCILKANGDYKLIGSFIEKDGCFYSNSSFENNVYYSYSSNLFSSSYKYIGGSCGDSANDLNKELTRYKIRMRELLKQLEDGSIDSVSAKDAEMIDRVEEILYDKKLYCKVNKDIANDANLLLLKIYDYEGSSDIYDSSIFEAI